MKITPKSSLIVRPATTTPQTDMGLSNLDLMAPNKYTSLVYFYQNKSNNTNMFSNEIMKDALSKVLVPYYPYAGRLSRATDGRLQITCNGKRVLLAEAEADVAIDDLGDLTPRNDFSDFIPKQGVVAPGSEVQNPDEVFLHPLLYLQVTFLKCGGVGLGIASMHKVVDGLALMHFINSWADVARGLEISPLPVHDRSLLRARDPPTPAFEHTEYQDPPSLRTKPATSSSEVSVSMFQFTRKQIDVLKSIARESSGGRNHTRFEVLASHIWRCACIARDLEKDQTTAMYINTDGRRRLSPPLPREYFGNAIFLAVPAVKAGDLVSKTGGYGADVIRQAVARLDEEYLKSALDYLEVYPFVRRGGALYGSPNIKIGNWTRLPFYNADFGWGRPIHTGPARIPFDGSGYIMRGPEDDGDLRVALALQPHHMEKFKTIVYNVLPSNL